MSSFVDDPNKKCRIYESVRRICDAQSTSEDSLDHRKRRRSLSKNSRATRTASLFIDRLKNEFQRDDDFLPRFRSYRNWCPNFTSKYFCQRSEKDERAINKSISKNFILKTPRVYSIGLYQPPRKRGKIRDDEGRKSVIDIGDTIKYLKRCTLITRSTPEINVPNDPPKVDVKTKEIVAIPSFPALPIPLSPSLPISTGHVSNDEDTTSRTKSSNYRRRVVSCDRSESSRRDLRVHAKTTSLPNARSKKRIYSTEFDSRPGWSTSREDFVYCSISRKSFREEDSQEENGEKTKEQFVSNEDSISIERESTRNEGTTNDCIKCERITINIVNCKTSQEFLEYSSPEQYEDLFLEEVSSTTSKSKEFFSPLGTGRPLETVSRVSYGETEILEDIRRRIDEDFERSSYKCDGDYEDFCLSYDSRYYDNVSSWENDSFLDPDDDPITGIDQSKSVPTITITSTNRRSSRSVTIMSSTLLEDDFYDLKSPGITLSRNTLKEYRTVESNDSEYPSYTDLSSMNSIICQSTYDFPSACLESTIVTSDKSRPTGSFSISDISKQEYYESVSSRNEVSCLDFTKETENILTSSKFEYETIEGHGDYDRSKSNLTKDLLIRGSSMRQSQSSKYLVESIDSGVMTDVSRNDLRAYSSIVERNTCYIYENYFDANETNDTPTFDFDSDSSYSDESLDRRVEMAIKKCTEDLILIERKIKIRLRRMEHRMDDSMDDLPACFDWSSGDERICSISTPSLVSLTDSDEG